MASHGSIEPFEVSSGQWASYALRLGQYLAANGITDADKQRATMLTVIGGPAFNLLTDLLAPTEVTEKSYDESCQTLEDHLKPKTLVIGERYRFFQRDQRPSESVSAYVAELRRLARACEFKDHLPEALRDRFVYGLRSAGTRRKLLAIADLTFDKAVTDAQADELATRDAVEVSADSSRSGASGGSSSVHQVYSTSKTRLPSGRQAETSPCYRCGGQHLPKECRFRDAECRFCHKIGHLQRVCRSKNAPADSKKAGSKPVPKPRGRKSTSTHHVMTDYSRRDSADEMIKYVRVAHVAGTPPAPIFADAKVHGQTLRFEVDTGAGVSILPAALYIRKFADQPLQPCRLCLTTYNGETLHSQGVMCVPVEINGQRADAELYVVDCEGPPLLGRAWLEQFRLDWTAVHAITTVPASQAVQDLKARYQAVFGSDQGRMKGVQARLTLKPDAVPRFMKAQSVPLALRPKVEEELHRMEKAGIVTKVDWSSWATPVVPVVKPNGKVRLCGDFKVTVNPQLCVDQHPLPLIDDIFASLSGGTRFTTLDRTAAYTQMEVEDDSRPLLTLNTHMGLYRLNRLAYGVASAPALWQRAMDALLRNIPMVECTIDDIIISGHNDEEHLHHLEEVLTRLEKAGLRLNPQKCKFLANTVQYCGHTISKEGIHTMPSKVDAIQNAPAPETVSQVRSFVGLVTYYQRFIPDMATMLNPLTSLLQKDRQFQWTPECAAAFHQVKTVLALSKVLAHYDANLTIRVACDASPYGLGAVLSHIYPNGEERPIAFASRKLTSAEQGYSQIDKEALGIVWAIKKFNHYLCARQFELLTDHQPPVSIFNPNKSLPGMTTARLQRYAMYLAGHQYIIKYRNTHRHCNADGLSRLPISNTASDDHEDEAIHIYYASQTDPLPVTAAQIRMQTSRDLTLASVLQFVKQGWPERCPSSELHVYFNRRNELTAHLDCLVWRNRTVIPPKLQPAVLDELHEGHPGIVRMKAIARSYVWWQGIDASLETRVKACPGCQQTQNQPAAAPLHPWMHPARPWQRVHIDFLGPLRGMMWLVAIDAHSKWPEVLPFRTTTTATDTIQALRTVFARYGCPEEIVSDNGPQFTSTDFGSFLEANGIRHRHTAPYHPATNGLAERFVQSFKKEL